MVSRVIEERNKNSHAGVRSIEYYQPTPRAKPQVRSRSSCMRISLCFILMSKRGLIKSMWTGVSTGVNSALESLSGGILGPGDGGNDSGEELDEEFE